MKRQPAGTDARVARPAPRVLYAAEPHTTRAIQPPAVVDCSVLAAVLWSEPAAEQARGRLAAHSLHAPGLLAYELANVARSKWRAGVPQPAALEGLLAFEEQRITLHEMDPVHMFGAAARYGLTAYDAAYLLLATALQAPLLTFDKRLGDAAAQAIDRGG